jgi:UDP-3-O-[3-hydroxymyristoyl] glucosamine N-acyltransferase
LNLTELLELNPESILNDLKADYTCEGQARKVKSVSSLHEATQEDLSFSYDDGEKAAHNIGKSNAGVILCKRTMKGTINPKPRQAFLYVDNPRLILVRILNLMYYKRKLTGLSNQATISNEAKIGANCYIGDFSIIGDNCTIGDNTMIYGRVTLENCVIGNNCIVHPGVTIGSDGLSFERDEESGELEKFPHLKGVMVGNDVEIFANTTITRGSLSNTVIGDQSKIAGLVYVSHNVVIGKSCEITPGTCIGGSTTLGDMCWTGLNCTLKNRIKIGNNVIIAAGAAVVHDVPDRDIVAGVPAKSIRSKVTTSALFRMAGQRQLQNMPRKKN